MARWRSAIAILLGTLAPATAAAAQVVTLARTDYLSDAGARAIVVADLNRDAIPDLAVANASGHSISILPGRSSTTVIPRPTRMMSPVDAGVGAGSSCIVCLPGWPP